MIKKTKSFVDRRNSEKFKKIVQKIRENRTALSQNALAIQLHISKSSLSKLMKEPVSEELLFNIADSILKNQKFNCLLNDTELSEIKKYHSQSTYFKQGPEKDKKNLLRDFINGGSDEDLLTCVLMANEKGYPADYLKTLGIFYENSAKELLKQKLISKDNKGNLHLFKKPIYLNTRQSIKKFIRAVASFIRPNKPNSHSGCLGITTEGLNEKGILFFVKWLSLQREIMRLIFNCKDFQGDIPFTGILAADAVMPIDEYDEFMKGKTLSEKEFQKLFSKHIAPLLKKRSTVSWS